MPVNIPVNLSFHHVELQQGNTCGWHCLGNGPEWLSRVCQGSFVDIRRSLNNKSTWPIDVNIDTVQRKLNELLANRSDLLGLVSMLAGYVP